MSAVSSTWAEEMCRYLKAILCPRGRAGGKVGNKPRVAFSPAACPHVTSVTVMSTLQGTQGSRYFTYNWLRC